MDLFLFLIFQGLNQGHPLIEFQSIRIIDIIEFVFVYLYRFPVDGKFTQEFRVTARLTAEVVQRLDERSCLRARPVILQFQFQKQLLRQLFPGRFRGRPPLKSQGQIGRS